ncbi:hypothetical protein V8F20_003132 [Naviculisporaceae sp. PSN 640]
MALLKLGTVLALAAYVGASPLPVAGPIDNVAEPKEANQPLGCSNWLPTVVSGLTNENDVVTIGICAAEPTALVQKAIEQAALEPPDETTTSTVTVTRTTSINGTFSPRPTPLRPTTVTVHRTFTVSAWTKTTTTLALVNCTRTVLASTPLSTRTLIPPTTRAIPPPSPVPSNATASPVLAPRQFPFSNTTSIPVTPPPALVTATAPRQRTVTRTAWNVTTITQSGDLVRTRYDCSHTIAYAFTVDSTTTIVYTVTSVPVTATVVSTLSCNAFGFGIPGLPVPTTPPRTSPIPTPPSSPTSNPVIPTVSVFRRQQNSTTSASAVVSPTVVAPAPVSTVVIHLTRTAYRATTVTASVGRAQITYVCSPSSSSTAPTPSAAPTTAATAGFPTGGLPTGTLPTARLPTTGAGLPTSVLFPTTGLPTIPLPTLTLG